ncbi:MAG: HemK2/MTQ2 family protein methyltransferase [Candidatus Helarchaeota archaeon]
MKLWTYLNVNYTIYKGVYEPSDDTFLLIDNLTINKGEHVLELGTGTGLISIFAAQNTDRIVATDISLIALRCALKNFKLNGVSSKIELRQGDLFEPIHPNEKFDLILFNPPYLPSDPREKNDTLTRSWSSGKDGRIIIDRFLQEFPNYLRSPGRVLLIQSSLSNPNKTIEIIKEKKMKIKKIKEQKFFFERIILFLIEKN